MWDREWSAPSEAMKEATEAVTYRKPPASAIFRHTEFGRLTVGENVGHSVQDFSGFLGVVNTSASLGVAHNRFPINSCCWFPTVIP